jgi:alpha-glucosidase
VPDGQWYYHHFAPEQPELNWDNEEVREDFIKTLRFWSDHGADGFRVDVAHGLAHDVSEPYAPWEMLSDFRWVDDGSHPLWDRDAVHDIYASWRTVFNEYDPPRFAVAEAHSHKSRRARYASREGLGQTFNFDMQDADWDRQQYFDVIDYGLSEARASGSTTTWLLGNHDVPRVASRFGLPKLPGKNMIDTAREWLLTDGRVPELDRKLGERRARAAMMIKMALPGSAYIYQGEELGLHEVAELPWDELQDPMVKNGSGQKGRDGCRVPVPWNILAPSFGFGRGKGWLPQPEWFAKYAAYEQARDPESTLWLYRRALAERKLRLPAAGEEFEWVKSSPEVLHFRRGERWQSITNFGEDAVEIPEGKLVLSSVRLRQGQYLPQDVTVWVETR